MLRQITLHRAVCTALLAFGFVLCLHVSTPAAQAQDSTVVLKGMETTVPRGG